MAKGPGWYPDPWGGEGLRWWDGSNWSEHVQGQAGPGYSVAATMRGGPLVQPGSVIKWYHQWWFIWVMLFVCSGCIGLVLTWTRPGTPTSIKLIITVFYFVIQFMILWAMVSVLGRMDSGSGVPG